MRAILTKFKLLKKIISDIPVKVQQSIPIGPLMKPISGEASDDLYIRDKATSTYHMVADRNRKKDKVQ